LVYSILSQPAISAILMANGLKSSVHLLTSFCQMILRSIYRRLSRQASWGWASPKSATSLKRGNWTVTTPLPGEDGDALLPLGSPTRNETRPTNHGVRYPYRELDLFIPEFSCEGVRYEKRTTRHGTSQLTFKVITNSCVMLSGLFTWTATHWRLFLSKSGCLFCDHVRARDTSELPW